LLFVWFGGEGGRGEKEEREGEGERDGGKKEEAERGE
jgi:hypothetical protein